MVQSRAHTISLEVHSKQRGELFGGRGLLEDVYGMDGASVASVLKHNFIVTLTITQPHTDHHTHTHTEKIIRVHQINDMGLS